MNEPTKKLFVEDVYLKACESKILKIVEVNQEAAIALILDQTLFFPTGGGQPCDLGTINGLPLCDVAEKQGVIYHYIAKPCQEREQNSTISSPLSLKEGSTVSLRLDWNRRFRHMQRHCGEHILSGIFFQETGGVNRGFHMGETYMTIDIDTAEINQDQIVEIERLANEVIWSNQPVITRYFARRKDAENLPLRKPLALEEDISIVCVGNIDNPADCVACCGTHPSSSGQVGLIKILKTEHYKGMSRIYFEAGQDALWDYEKKHNLVTKLNAKYSAGEDTLLEKIRIQDEKNRDLRQELYTVKTSVISMYADEILQEYHSFSEEGATGQSSVLVKEYDILKINDLLTIGKKVTAHIKGLLLLLCTEENTVLLFSNGNPDCGKLVKENAPIYNGKGGGNKRSARALFKKREYVDTFVELLEKHLR